MSGKTKLRPERPSAHQRGYGVRWRKERAAYLQSNPLCVLCEKASKFTAASVVDHVKPHKGNEALFWDKDNWQSLCKSCHDAKTASEDGGFGNRIRNRQRKIFTMLDLDTANLDALLHEVKAGAIVLQAMIEQIPVFLANAENLIVDKEA